MVETVRPPSFAFEGSCSVGALLPFTLLLSGFSGADAFLFLWQTVKVLPFHLPQLRRMTLRGVPVSGFCSSHPRVGGAVLRTAGHGRALGRPFSRSPFSPDVPHPLDPSMPGPLFSPFVRTLWGRWLPFLVANVRDRRFIGWRFRSRFPTFFLGNAFAVLPSFRSCRCPASLAASRTVRPFPLFRSSG